MFNGESGDGQRSDGARDIVRKGKTKDSSRCSLPILFMKIHMA